MLTRIFTPIRCCAFTNIDAETASAYGVGATAYFIDEDAFRALCEANSLDADAYLNAETPVAIAFNHPSTIMESGNSRKLVDYDVFKSERSSDNGHAPRMG